jgi:hypothetical protein
MHRRSFLSPGVLIGESTRLDFVTSAENIMECAPGAITVFGYDIGILCVAGIFQSRIETGLWCVACVVWFIDNFSHLGLLLL